MHTGPFTKMLGGADISWILSLLVTALVDYPLARKTMKVPADMIYPADEAPAASASYAGKPIAAAALGAHGNG